PHGPNLRRQHTGVNSAVDFRTQVPHGPGAVRVLISAKQHLGPSSDGRQPPSNALTPASFPTNLCPGCAPQTLVVKLQTTILNSNLVGGPGFEPGASRSRTVRAAKLRQPPTPADSKRARGLRSV